VQPAKAGHQSTDCERLVDAFRSVHESRGHPDFVRYGDDILILVWLNGGIGKCAET